MRCFVDVIHQSGKREATAHFGASIVYWSYAAKPFGMGWANARDPKLAVHLSESLSRAVPLLQTICRRSGLRDPVSCINAPDF